MPVRDPIWCLLFLAFWSVPGVGLVVSQAAESLPAIDYSRLVADLGAEEFSRRASAEQKLLAAGERAFDPLKQALEKTPLESGHRVLAVMEQIWLRTPVPAADRLEQQLEEMVHTPGPWQPFADQILRSHHVLRENRAVRALRRMNAIIEYENDLDLYSQLLEEGIEGTVPQVIKHVTLPKTWNGGDAGLWHVGRLAHRSSLGIYVIPGNGITEAGMDHVRSTFPGLLLAYRSEVCMGVEGDQNLFGGIERGGCLLKAVHVGGSADLAGLRRFDRILSVNDQSLNDFQDLVDSLKGLRAYDSCEMIVNRGGEVLTIQVVLLPWEVFLLPRPPSPPASLRLADIPPVQREFPVYNEN